MNRSSPPGRSAPDQLRRRAEQHRRVPVVPARVHRAGPLGGELHAALLVDRQRVDVRAQRDRRPRPSGLQPREDAGLGRPLDGQPEALEPLGHPGRRLVLGEADLGIAVQMAPPGTTSSSTPTRRQPTGQLYKMLRASLESSRRGSRLRRRRGSPRCCRSSRCAAGAAPGRRATRTRRGRGRGRGSSMITVASAHGPSITSGVSPWTRKRPPNRDERVVDLLQVPDDVRVEVDVREVGDGVCRHVRNRTPMK